jgi:hypothetical protein
MRVIIAGSRNFTDYELLKQKCDSILNFRKVEIISGGARGADLLGERYALERGYDIKRFIPDWSIGKSAGYIRNENMAKYASDRDQKLEYLLNDKSAVGGLIVFWDGKSRGSKHMIDLASKYNLKTRVIKYDIGQYE